MLPAKHLQLHYVREIYILPRKIDEINDWPKVQVHVT